MRIISGKYKGIKIHPPQNLPVRPTTDMAKEALFNILNNYIDFEEIEVLDLFCGTGSVSYEFISRGCKNVTSVDINSKCIDFIEKTRDNLGIANLHAIKSDVITFISRSKRQWDLIFADPPFIYENHMKISEIIADRNILSDNGLLIIEHPENISYSKINNYIIRRNYGRISFSFIGGNKRHEL